MKKILFVILALSSLFAAFFVFATDNAPVAKNSQFLAAKTQRTQTQNKATEAARPVRLIINALNVNASVESVGMDTKGRMDVPKNVNNVSWYNLGYKPGENGSAVIAGHYDDPAGSPAVFYNLGDLDAGEMMQVNLENAKVLTYRVTGKKRYPTETVPTEQIFNTTDKPGLNLITCDGVWNKAEQSYSNRLVVFTELVQ